jgi:hypothetical protein
MSAAVAVRCRDGCSCLLGAAWLNLSGSTTVVTSPHVHRVLHHRGLDEWVHCFKLGMFSTGSALYQHIWTCNAGLCTLQACSSCMRCRAPDVEHLMSST